MPVLAGNDPIPLRQRPYFPMGQLRTGPKLAFYPGPHPAFEAQYDQAVADTDRLARSEQDNTLWAGAFLGTVEYPREIAQANNDIAIWPSADSVTEYVWGMGNNGGISGRQPLSSRPATGNFFASDPMQFGSVGGGFLSGMSGGGAVANDGTYTPGGAWGFLTPGAEVWRTTYRQNYWSPVNPTMTTKDLQASSVFNPIPAFGTVVPKLP